MEQKLNLTISAIDRATGTLRTVKSSVVDLGSATSRLAPQFAAVNQGLAELSQMAAGAAQTSDSVGGLAGNLGGMVGMVGGVAAVGAGLIMVGDAIGGMAERGAELQRVEASFDSLTASVSSNSAEMMSAMQAATNNTINQKELMLAANQAIVLGVASSASEMAQLSAAAIARGQQLGVSAAESLDKLIVGIGRISPLRLDDLGIVGVTQAIDDYAASLGTTSDMLTDVQKKQALVNAVLEDAKTIGPPADDAAASLERMAAASDNAWAAIDKLVAPGVAAALNAVAAGVNAAMDPKATIKVETSDVETAIALTGTLYSTTEQAATAAATKIQTLAQELNYYKGMVEEFANIPNPQPQQIETKNMYQGYADRAMAEIQQLTEFYNRLMGVVPAAMDVVGERSIGTFLEITAAGEAAAASIVASFDKLEGSMGTQIDSLTKGLIDDIGALAALDLNSSLKAEMADIIAAYQAAGISAEAAGYLMVEWLNNEAEAARIAVANTNAFARSANEAGKAGARSVGPLRAMAGALNAVAMAAAAGQGGGRMDKWERLNYDLTGITPKAYALKGGFDALGATFDSFAASAGGAASSLSDFESPMDGIGSKVQGLLGESLNLDVGVNTGDFLPREDAINEDARRLADVMVNGFSSPWAAYFQTEFPALFAEMTAGGDIQSGAAAMLQQFQQGLRPELIDQDLVKDRIKAMLVGDANMAALAAEITGELQAELAGMDPAQISGMVNGALGIKTGDTGVGAGIEDELGNAALLTKIEGTGTTAGKSWGGAFLTYVQNNVPAALVGLLVDLVTPGVRAKLIEDSSAGGAVP